ncbi:hypothetical protein FKM82_028887 [Ascaphus truei]
MCATGFQGLSSAFTVALSAQSILRRSVIPPYFIAVLKAPMTTIPWCLVKLKDLYKARYKKKSNSTIAHDKGVCSMWCGKPV